MTLSAYMIEKFKDEEDKNKNVEGFDLNINELLQDNLFLSYCQKFNKDNKDNYKFSFLDLFGDFCLSSSISLTGHICQINNETSIICP
jgi:hypothetical protein